jgi:hypothetical protein
LNAVLVLTGALKRDLGYGSPVPGRGSITRGSSLRYEGKICQKTARQIYEIYLVSNGGEKTSRELWFYTDCIIVVRFQK